MKENGKLAGHLACFGAYAIFGFNIIVCKDLMGGHLVSPLAIFTLRSLGAGLLFWILSLFMPREKVDLRDLPKIFLASFLGFFLTQLTFLEAIPDITPMHCSIISALTPVYTMFIAALVLKEPLTLKKGGGVLLSLCGIPHFEQCFCRRGGREQVVGNIIDDPQWPQFCPLSGCVPSGDCKILCGYIHEVDFPLLNPYVPAILLW